MSAKPIARPQSPQRFFLNAPKQKDGECYVLNSDYMELDVYCDFLQREAGTLTRLPADVHTTLNDIYKTLCVAWDNRTLPASVVSAEQFTRMREALGIPFPGYAKPGSPSLVPQSCILTDRHAAMKPHGLKECPDCGAEL